MKVDNSDLQESKTHSIYISSGCNRCPKALDWGGKQDQIIYAHANSVALLSQTEPFEIKSTFNKHTDKVNAVKWITSNGFIDKNLIEFSEFASASKDKSVIVWQGYDNDYEPYQQLDGHTNNICVVDGMYYNTNDSNILTTYLASASVDSTVRIWSRTSNLSLKSVDKSSNKETRSLFELEQIITSKMNGFALALKFYSLPLSKLPLLLIGFENHKIEIYVRLHNDNENKNKFYCLHTMIGHEDWIRDIDVCQTNDNQLLIASSSQDNYIRLWKLDSSIAKKKDELENSDVIIEEMHAELISKKLNLSSEPKEDEDDDDEDNELATKKAEKIEQELKLKSSLFTIHSEKLNSYIQYSINLESVLYGHEDWIYTVKFHPRIENKQPLILISASMDKTLVIWKYDEENSIWIDTVKQLNSRVGDIGGNTLGFYGATFEPNGKYIVAHGYQGALHLWKRNLDENKSEQLVPAVINGGHFDLVEDLCWEPNQQFLISVSKDQTCRFHGYWKHDGKVTWHELGRPQIHGYDLKCVSFINRFKFVSGADEKLLRVFEAPKIFLQNFYNLCQDKTVLELVENTNNTMPQGASVPALGLSNKAVFDEEKKTTETNGDKRSIAEELYKEVYFNKIDLTKPPTEEHLLQNTLWPEMQKLYGHGYELFAVAVDPKSKIIASACKASKADHAIIILWQEQSNNGQNLYKQFMTLKGHELTIVQLKFSNKGNYLLSVSRDRSWKLYKKTSMENVDQPMFELVRGIGSKNIYHTRIIWSCDWSHDDKYFVSTSRDRRVCIWPSEVKKDIENQISEKPLVAVKINSSLYLELSDSITACAFAPDLTSDNKYLLAFGFENGGIEFFTWSLTEGFNKYSTIENRYSHHLTVKKLSFRRITEIKQNYKIFCLASCADDCSVRLFEIDA